MALDVDYLSVLLREIASGLAGEQRADVQVRLEAADAGLDVVLHVRGRRLVQPVEDPVYHYEPDGSDPSRHASWLVQLFDEEAR